MNASVSVVITTCNRKELLARAVDSAQKQTLPPKEIIIVDDCSTDGTADMFANRESESIRYIYLTEKSGANVARNRGIEASKGKYIAFLDDDDFWKPEKLAVQVEEMKRLDAPFSYTGLHNVDPQENTLKKRFYPPSNPENIRQSLMINNFMGSTSSIVVKKDFIVNNNVRFDINLGAMQDYDFYLSCFAHTNKVAAISSCLTYYHQERSIFTGKTSANHEIFARARAYLFEKYQNDPDIHFLRKSLNTVYVKKCIKYPRFLLSALRSFLRFH